MMRRNLAWLPLALLPAAMVAAFSCGSDETATGKPGGGWQAEAGVGGTEGGTAGSGTGGMISNTGGTGTGGSEAGPSIVCEPACKTPYECVNGQCLPHQDGCTSNAQCDYDTWCSAGQCVPYAAPPDDKQSNPSCKLTIPAEMLVPSIKCEFMKAPDGDAYPTALEVRITPMVANFNAGAAGSPSIVAPFGFTWGTQPANPCGYEDCNYRYGVIRVLSGKDCSLEANIGGEDLDPTPNGLREWARSSSPVALADLDGDKQAEIIAYMVEEPEGQEVVVAWTRKSGAWKPLWPTAKATLSGGGVFDANIPVSGTSGADWAGPSVHDLDDDGVPEIIREGWVINGATGVVRASPPAEYASYSVGIIPVLANLDDDPRIEMTNGAYVWEFDPTTNTWLNEAWYSQTTATGSGWAAVADFNPYDGLATPEIAVARAGKLSIYNHDHSVFMNMDVDVPSGGGGPPTIADYDGDGLPEVGVAGADYYSVFDPDCQATPRQGGKCTSRDKCDYGTNGACTDYILWSRRSQDHSSRITGSSVFDFEADGKAEVVYADECFARVYSGSDGHVLFSQYRSSSTWLENPVVADVDGDYRSELIVPSNGAANFTAAYCAGLINADGVEEHFAGLICKTNADCISGSCVEGLCRCTASSQCCTSGDDAACEEFGYKCAPPPASAPGAGNTCRASYPHGLAGIRVYKDSHDRWVRSRTIWSQHAYAVTHINEDGTVPKTSDWKNNWTQPGLNNFRQNVPGEADGKDIGDLTADVVTQFQCAAGVVTLSAPVCNRGTAPVGAGLVVGFYNGADKVCEAVSQVPIPVGQCISVGCTWDSPPSTSTGAVDVKVVPNDGGGFQECIPENNEGLVTGVWCQSVR